MWVYSFRAVLALTPSLLLSGFCWSKLNQTDHIGLTLPLSFLCCSAFCLKMFGKTRHLTSGHSHGSNYLPIGFGPQNWEEKRRVSVFPLHIFAHYLTLLPLQGNNCQKANIGLLLRFRKQQRPLPITSLPAFPIPGREQLSQIRPHLGLHCSIIPA